MEKISEKLHQILNCNQSTAVKAIALPNSYSAGLNYCYCNYFWLVCVSSTRDMTYLNNINILENSIACVHTSRIAAQNLLCRTLCRAWSLGGGNSPLRWSRSSSSMTLHMSKIQKTLSGPWTYKTIISCSRSTGLRQEEKRKNAKNTFELLFNLICV